ncbi:MAG: hypothetical protein RL497_2114 [Pseudomonadota bacterium]|jgi:AraC-like DNA-binding protein
MNTDAAFILITISLILWAALALLFDKQGQRKVNLWVAALISIEFLPQAYFYTMATQPPGGDFHWAVLAQSALLLKGPVGFALTLCLIGQKINRFYTLHFMAFGIAVLDLNFGSMRFDIWAAGGSIHALAYLGIAIKMLIQDKRRLHTIVHHYTNSAHYWAVWILGGLGIIILANLMIVAVGMWQGQIRIELFRYLSWSISVYWIALAFCSIYRPEIFVNRFKGVSQADDALEALPVEDTEEGKQWRELDDGIATGLATQLEALMHKHIYRQHDLSLVDLAKRLGISVHQTSELLNVHFGQSFFDYMNGARLQYACELLRDTKSELRIIDVAFEAGFGNKNSFYRYFKKAYDLAPNEYRNQWLMGVSTLPEQL